MKNIKVLGSENCSTCTNLKDKIAKLVEEKGLDVKVEKVTDIVEVMKYGVMSSPAVVIDDDVKCAGRLPNDKELDEWLS
ncbi:MAG: thioredoxin family protein [Alphaproteobacteria bacterium]|nr:thioredoxin family protein [Alphaproteobacteria bacterium]